MARRIPLPPALASRGFTVREAREAGVRAGRLRGSDLDARYRGIRLPAGMDDRLTICLALQSTLPPDAWFSGSTAATLMGVPLPRRIELDRRVHVSVPADRRAPAAKGIHAHSVQVSTGHRRDWRGIQISTPERAWCELASELALDDLVAAGDFLVHWRLPFTTPEALTSAIHSYPARRGKPRLEEAVTLLDERSESRRESRLRVILVRGGIPGVVTNLPIRTSGGYRYRADLAVPGRKVLIEYQSEFHNDPDRFRRDMTRRSRLEADGWFVIEVNADDLRNPAELLIRVRRVLAARPEVA